MAQPYRRVSAGGTPNAYLGCDKRAVTSAGPRGPLGRAWPDDWWAQPQTRGEAAETDVNASLCDQVLGTCFVAVVTAMASTDTRVTRHSRSITTGL